MSLAKRKTNITIKPSLIISKNADLWCIAIDMKTKGTETLFEEGVEIDTCNDFIVGLTLFYN